MKGLIYWLSFLLFVVDLFGRHVSEANHRGGVVCLMMENLAACHRFVGANELEQICGQVVNKLSKLTDCDNLWGKLMCRKNEAKTRQKQGKKSDFALLLPERGTKTRQNGKKQKIFFLFFLQKIRKTRLCLIFAQRIRGTFVGNVG